MRKRDEISDLSSCLNKAHEDEPVFVLRANDPLAHDLVETWAEQYRARHMNQGTFTTDRQFKYVNALKASQTMREWRDEKAREAYNHPQVAAEALNAIREKVRVQGDELILRHGFWVTLRDSLGLSERVTGGIDESQVELFR